MPDCVNAIPVSVVTPTRGRPAEVAGMLENLSRQTVAPVEVILVDGAPPDETATEQAVASLKPALPFDCVYVRAGGGTAIQRNVGVENATGDFVAFIDDDIRLDPDYLEKILEAFASDAEGRVGGIAGCIRNQYLNPATSLRWRWYRRLRLFRTYEPGRYDYETGYPINRYLQPPHESIREIDFMGTACAVWRRAVFDSGLRFSDFFRGYAVVEDAHFALRAGRRWKLLEVGSARCIHLRSPLGRVNSRQLGRMSATNYRYVFVDLVPRRTWRQEFRFWRVQIVDLFRMLAYAVRARDKSGLCGALGKIEGMVAAVRIRPDDYVKEVPPATARRKARLAVGPEAKEKA